jgi:hypothetical protein
MNSSLLINCSTERKTISEKNSLLRYNPFSYFLIDLVFAQEIKMALYIFKTDRINRE